MGRRKLNEESPDAIIPSGENFSETYIEECFLAWYRLGRPGMQKLLIRLETDPDGRHPSTAALTRWQNVGRWTERADSMDAEVAKEVQETAIKEKVEMMRRHADYAVELQKKGIEYIRAHNFDKSADAIRAVIQGMEEERNSRGMQIALGELSKLTDEQLVKYVEDQISQAALPKTPEAESDVVEGQVKDAE